MDRTSKMYDAVHVSLEPEANSTVVAALSRLLGPDLRAARDKADLKKRLALKGFQVRLGYLATAPQGKLVCPIASL